MRACKCLFQDHKQKGPSLKFIASMRAQHPNLYDAALVMAHVCLPDSAWSGACAVGRAPFFSNFFSNASSHTQDWPIKETRHFPQVIRLLGTSSLTERMSKKMLTARRELKPPLQNEMYLVFRVMVLWLGWPLFWFSIDLRINKRGGSHADFSSGNSPNFCTREIITKKMSKRRWMGPLCPNRMWRRSKKLVKDAQRTCHRHQGETGPSMRQRNKSR